MTQTQFDIHNTWFYQTNLKNHTDLQEALTSDFETSFELKSQLISGSVGVGKTYNALILTRDYIHQTVDQQSTWNYRFEPYFVTFMEYVQLLNDQRFGSEETKNQAYYKLQDISGAEFLILDDLKASHGSQFEKNTLDNALLNLLSIFWANRKSRTLIVTSNNSDEEIRASYSEAVCSRLFGLCEYIEVNGHDKRILQSKNAYAN